MSGGISVGPVLYCQPGAGLWVRGRMGRFPWGTLGGRAGSSGSTIGTLGGRAGHGVDWGWIVVGGTGTLGDGAGLGSTTWACTVSSGSGGGAGMLGGLGLGVTWRKISARAVMASACGRLSVAYGAAGAGLRRAWVRSWAASVAASADDIRGMGRTWGKNSTVSLFRSARVLVMYTLWHL